MMNPAPQIPPRRETFAIVPKEPSHSLNSTPDPHQSFKENIERMLNNQNDTEAINFVATQLKSAQRRTLHGDLLKQRLEIISIKLCNDSANADGIPQHSLPPIVFREIVRASQQTDLSGIIEPLICSTKITRAGVVELLASVEQNHMGATNILYALSRKAQFDEIIYTNQEGRSAQEVMLKETQRGAESRSKSPEHAFKFLCTRCEYLKHLSETDSAHQQDYDQALLSLKNLFSDLSLRPLHRLYEATLEKMGEWGLADITLKLLKHDANKLNSIWSSIVYKQNSFAQIAYLLKADTPEILKNSWLERLKKLEDPILTKILTPKRLTKLGIKTI